MIHAMHPRPRRRARHSIRRRQVAALALSLGGLVLAAMFLGVTVQANVLARDIAGLRADIAAAAADRAALDARIAEQQTADYVVQRARDYGLIGPNESLYAVQRNEQGSAQSVNAKAVPSRIERWVRFFFGSR
jgi:cell division protein FtsB